VNGAVLGHGKVYQMNDPVSGWMQLGDDIDGEVAYENPVGGWQHGGNQLSLWG
jgi:hypothetical protein